MKLANGDLYNILEVGLSPTPSELSGEEENGSSSDEDQSMDDIPSGTPNESSEETEDRGSGSSSDEDFKMDHMPIASMVHPAARSALGEGKITNFDGEFPQECRSVREGSISDDEEAGWNTSQLTVVHVQCPSEGRSLPEDRGKAPSTSV